MQMQNEQEQIGIESVTMSELLDTWNRPRSDEEIKSFISNLEQR